MYNHFSQALQSKNARPTSRFLLLFSLLPCRQMAIANAIGSNVFNILLGLGGPWLVSSLVSGEPTAVSGDQYRPAKPREKLRKAHEPTPKPLETDPRHTEPYIHTYEEYIRGCGAGNMTGRSLRRVPLSSPGLFLRVHVKNGQQYGRRNALCTTC